MAYGRCLLLLLSCFFLALAGCAGNKTESRTQQPGADMSTVADAAMPKPGTGLAALAGSGKPGSFCLLAMVPPADGPLNSPFGHVRGGKKSSRVHKGIDIGAKRGSAVIAAAAGKVIFSGKKKGFGRTVEIEHEEGIVTRYAHLDAILASEGQTVRQSDRIGLVGSNGRASGPHLHFELLAQGRQIDPLSVGWMDTAAGGDAPRQAPASGMAGKEMTFAAADVQGAQTLRVKSGKDAKVAGVKPSKPASRKPAGAKAAGVKIANAKTAGAKTANAKTAGAKPESAQGAKSAVAAAGKKAAGAKIAGAKKEKSQARQGQPL
jgi:murein DD-endopeptidase MepM/ murein hydrolase activator NlpD